MKKPGLLIFLLLGSLIRLSAFDGYLDIINNTGFPVYYVFISPHDADSWGDEILGNDIVIENGETHRIELINRESSVCDIRIEDVDGDYYTMEEVDLKITSMVTFTPDNMNQEENDLVGEVTVTGSGGPVNGTYHLYNETTKDILYIYIRKNSGEWGADLLGDNDIFTNDGLFKIVLSDLSENIIDLKFEDKKGHTYTYSEIDLNQIKELVIKKEDRD
ncbi:MAG: hypothetical protein KAH21_01265 [Spirochaetaceae bacterium]|nr:hypothetical protein [Spirochaetaceae bacterium]